VLGTVESISIWLSLFRLIAPIPWNLGTDIYPRAAVKRQFKLDWVIKLIPELPIPSSFAQKLNISACPHDAGKATCPIIPAKNSAAPITFRSRLHSPMSVPSIRSLASNPTAHDFPDSTAFYYRCSFQTPCLH